jgi:hypothetical protein
VLFVADDPDSSDRTNPDRLVFSRGNLAIATSGLRFGVVGVPITLDDGVTQDHAQLVWRGQSDRTAEEAFARTDRGPIVETSDDDDRDERDAFLRDLLADGPVPARDVERNGRDAGGWSAKQLRKSLRRIGGRAEKTSYDGPWQWTLAAQDAPNLPKMPHTTEGNLGQLGGHLGNGDGSLFADDLFAGAVDVTDRSADE